MCYLPVIVLLNVFVLPNLFWKLLTDPIIVVALTDTSLFKPNRSGFCLGFSSSCLCASYGATLSKLDTLEYQYAKHPSAVCLFRNCPYRLLANRGQTFNTMISLSVQWASLMVPRFITWQQEVFHRSVFLPPEKQPYTVVYLWCHRTCECDWWTWTCTIIMPSSVICVIRAGIQLTGSSAQSPPPSPRFPTSSTQPHMTQIDPRS